MGEMTGWILIGAGTVLVVAGVILLIYNKKHPLVYHRNKRTTVVTSPPYIVHEENARVTAAPFEHKTVQMKNRHVTKKINRKM